jgi:hypothetical protein
MALFKTALGSALKIKNVLKGRFFISISLSGKDKD